MHNLRYILIFIVKITVTWPHKLLSPWEQDFTKCCPIPQTACALAPITYTQDYADYTGDAS